MKALVLSSPCRICALSYEIGCGGLVFRFLASIEVFAQFAGSPETASASVQLYSDSVPVPAGSQENNAIFCDLNLPSGTCKFSCNSSQLDPNISLPGERRTAALNLAFRSRHRAIT